MPTTSLARDIQRCKAVTCDREKTFSNVQLALPFDRTFENSRLYFHIERIRQFRACITSAHREKNSRCIDNPCSPYIRCKDT